MFSFENEKRLFLPWKAKKNWNTHTQIHKASF
jgi:hypothetical protein